MYYTKRGTDLLGVGLSRTGTFSTRIALTKMLGGKCYHGYVSSLDGEPEFWQKAADGLLTEQDWIQGLEGRGYTAGVGEPINYFYPEILKVIHVLEFVLKKLVYIHISVGSHQCSFCQY